MNAEPEQGLMTVKDSAEGEASKAADAEGGAARRWEGEWLVFQSLSECVVLIDDRGRIALANPAACKMLGWSAAELTGMPHHELISSPRALNGDDSRDRECAVCAILRGEAEHRAEGQHVLCKGGAFLKMECVSSAIREGGVPAGAAVLFRAMNGTLSGDGKVNAAEETFRSFFENAVEGVYQTSPEGRYIKANTALARLYGYSSPEELIATVKDIGANLYVDPKWRQEFLRLMNENGAVMGFEAPIRRRDGSTIWLLENGRTIYDAEGAPLYYEGTVYDITHRKRTEQHLLKSRRFIAAVADASPAILYVYDLREGSYIYLNHQVTKVLGYTVEDVISMGPQFIESFAHPDDRELLAERSRRLEEGEDGQAFLYEHRIKHLDGHWLHLQCRDTIFTRTAAGRPEQIIGMAMDITERKIAREELEKSREQLRALSARLQAVREDERVGIARELHDELGQTLTALGFDVSWLQSRCAKLGKSALAASIVEKLTSLSELIEPMIHTVQRVAVNLRPPVFDAFGLVAAIEWQAREFEKRCGVRCEVRSEWTSEIMGGEFAIAVFRIFQEILTNVARHAKASKVLVSMHEGAGWLYLVVKDNGRGITSGEESASLGILGMRERALAFNGSVAIEGVPGKGTSVTVRMPYAEIGADAARNAELRPRKETLRGSPLVT